MSVLVKTEDNGKHSIPSAPLVLKYLFGAAFSDGTEYFQSQDDISQLVPDKRTAYYDICEHHPETGNSLEWEDKRAIARKDIEIFQLEGDGFRYLVDLRDGHFETQFGKRTKGAVFFLDIPPVDAKLHLIYFRRRRHHFNAGGSIDTGLNITHELSQECEYHFGWRAEVDGKFIDCTMFVV